MPEFTICAVRDSPGERELLASWLAKWRERTTSISENEGCGCCVDIYQVVGPEEAMNELPPQMLAERADKRHGA